MMALSLMVVVLGLLMVALGLWRAAQGLLMVAQGLLMVAQGLERARVEESELGIRAPRLTNGSPVLRANNRFLVRSLSAESRARRSPKNLARATRARK